MSDIQELLDAMTGTDFTPTHLWEACHQVLTGGGRGAIVSDEDIRVSVHISVDKLAWKDHTGRCGNAPTLSVALALADHLGHSDEEIADARRDFESARERRWLGATMPDSMLDAHWYTVRLRALCVEHGSDRCDECPPPTGFRRSYGIWVAPHPYWPGAPRGVWRKN